MFCQGRLWEVPPCVLSVLERRWSLLVAMRPSAWKAAGIAGTGGTSSFDDSPLKRSGTLSRNAGVKGVTDFQSILERWSLVMYFHIKLLRDRLMGAA